MAIARRNEIVTVDLTLNSEEVQYLLGMLQNSMVDEPNNHPKIRSDIWNAIKEALYPPAAQDSILVD